MLTGNGSRKKTVLLTADASVEDGTWILTVSDLPNDAESIALMLDISLGQGDIVPKMELTEEADNMNLTLGQPVEGSVRVLIDGCIPPRNKPSQREADLPLLSLQMPFSSEYVPGLTNAVLWVGISDGRVEECPLSVRITTPEPPKTPDSTDTPGTEPSSRPDFDEKDPIPAETRIPVADSPSSSEVDTPTSESQLAESEPLGDPPTLLYLGCRETISRQGFFSVKLIFWSPSDIPPPAVLCFGGGQKVTLTLDRLAAGSILTYTFRTLTADCPIRFLIITPDETIELTYQNGIFQNHRSVSKGADRVSK